MTSPGPRQDSALEVFMVWRKDMNSPGQDDSFLR